MADLLTAAQRLQIRGAIQDVVDTFAKTPVLYKLKGNYVDDRMEETNPQYTDYNLVGFVEYSSNDSDEMVLDVDGNIFKPSITVLLGLDDLIALSLVDADFMPIFKPESDKFIVNGVSYKVKFVNVEGAFEQKNLVVNIYGERLDIML